MNRPMALRKLVTRPTKWFLKRFGYEIVPTEVPLSGEYPPDFEPEEIADYRAVAPFTLTGPERTVTLMRAIQYLVKHRIPGDVVECGVWKGGSMMAAARALIRQGSTERRLWLFDTFEGLPEPTDDDVSVCGRDAWEDHRTEWMSIPQEEVRAAVLSTGYPSKNVLLVAGRVEETVPAQSPDQIALLRLDTDWYESTRHELIHLYPRLVPRGILIVDDYGHWRGARKATDEYFEAEGIPIYLHRIDFSARIAVKPT